MRIIRILFLCLMLCSLGSSAVPSGMRFSNEFYAAQKYFYHEALKKFPKLAKDKYYPEIPVRGNISPEELKSIAAMPDFFEARRVFTEEVKRFPEQAYPEIFRFLFNHPGLQVSPSNKAKFEALEAYFLAFNHLFCSDKYYYFHPNAKTSPCPLVFIYSDDKKNSLSLNLYSSLKSPLNLLLSFSPGGDYLIQQNKGSVTLKSGSSQSLKLQVNLSKLKSDSLFRTISLVLNDPAQPRIKIMAPVILLPSNRFLNAPAHFYDLTYSYNSHLKNIDLYKDRTSGPERCSNNNCSGKWLIPLRSPNREFRDSQFGEAGHIQFSFCSEAAPYSSGRNGLHFRLNELGSLEGKSRDCPGPVDHSSAPCPAESPNNGKQIYGTRRIDCGIYIPETGLYILDLRIDYHDLKTQFNENPELSWLQDKKLMITISDANEKILFKQLLTQSAFKGQVKDLKGGHYRFSLFPVTEDSSKPNPAFEMNYLNQAGRAHFDFELNAELSLVPLK
ncbi:MAG TPA: hypothetical protein PLQ93_08520 [Bacteroidia bacterium]|nr:hypothetical protein [Bacteroidia bacterium]